VKLKTPTARAAHSLEVVPVVRDALNWRHVVFQLQTECPHAEAVGHILHHAQRAELGLIAPIAAAWAIAQRPALLAGAAPLRIAILGASDLDSGIDGRLYGLIPWLLGQPERAIEVELVGPELEVYPAQPRGSSAHQLPPAARYPVNCGQWWAQRPAGAAPDILFIFHPGFEAHVTEWFEAGQLPTLLATGIPIVAFSFDADEAERDRALLGAFGVETRADAPCPFAVHDQADPVPGRRFEWATAGFHVTSYAAQEPNAARIAAILELAHAMMEIGAAPGAQFQHQDAWRPCLLYRGAVLCTVLHVFDRIYYDPRTREFLIGMRGRQREDLLVLPADDLDVLALLETLESPLDRALAAFTFYRMVVPRRDLTEEMAQKMEVLLDSFSEPKSRRAAPVRRAGKARAKKKSRGR
jgi:hypothetical protein